MESDSNFSGGSSSRIQNLVEDLGDENFETRNEALMTLKAMLPTSEVSISNRKNGRSTLSHQMHE